MNLKRELTCNECKKVFYGRKDIKKHINMMHHFQGISINHYQYKKEELAVNILCYLCISAYIIGVIIGYGIK